MIVISPRNTLLLPGWQNSGPDHWQSRWEALHGYHRVDQHDWMRPLRGDWSARLEETVADADGLSWYSEEALCRQLSCEAGQLHRDRAELQQAALIAYRQPLYQVLDLAPVTVPAPPGPRRGGEAMAVGDILKSILGGVR